MYMYINLINILLKNYIKEKYYINKIIKIFFKMSLIKVRIKFVNGKIKYICNTDKDRYVYTKKHTSNTVEKSVA